MIGEGSEPYDMDFGDSEYGPWLEKWLTPAELAERERRWQRYVGAIRFPSVGWGELRLRWWLVEYALLRPVRWWWLRRVNEIDQLARERGGPPPGPSWKVRMEFGEPRG